MPRHRVPPGTLCLGTVYPRYTVPRHGVPGGTLLRGVTCSADTGNTLIVLGTESTLSFRGRILVKF